MGTQKVIVVGGGIAGCTCAARLAAAGVKVIVLSSALDVVGLPGFGPIMRATNGKWQQITETLALLPDPLRGAWMSSAFVPKTNEPMLIIDRRALSIESKRVLEIMPKLEFRQGLVTNLLLNEPSPRVETMFGEAFTGDAVVLCPGLSLKGRIQVGQEIMLGGRYGEIPADDLFEALLSLGVKFQEVTMDVKTSYMSSDAFAQVIMLGCKANEAPQTTALAVNGTDWSSDYPPSPYVDEKPAVAGAKECKKRENAALQTHPFLVADGRATQEYCILEKSGSSVEEKQVDSGIVAIDDDELNCGSRCENRLIVTRMGHKVKGFVAKNVAPDGILQPLPRCVRMAGRAAGAQDYMDSIRSAVAVADSLLGKH